MGKALITIALVLLLGLVGGVIYMVEKSYELANTVVLPGPYQTTAKTKDFHQQLFIADMHADTFTFVDSFMQRKDYAHLDYPRAREGGINLLTMAIATEVPLSAVKHSPEGVKRDTNLIQILAIAGLEPVSNWTSNYARGLWTINNIRHTVTDHPDKLILVTHREDIAELLMEHTLGSNKHMGLLLAVEGGHLLEGKLDQLDQLYDQGVRMLSLTHAFDNEYGGASEGVEQYGLTETGKALLKRMGELGIIIDIAHASPALANDLLTEANNPLVYSHGGIQGTCDINRNLPDNLLEKIQTNGGLIAIGLWDRVLCGNTPKDVAASMRYVADRIGTKHLALGSDFDGGVKTITDASGIPLLTEALLENGFSKTEVIAIMGGNYADFLMKQLPAREP